MSRKSLILCMCLFLGIACVNTPAGSTDAVKTEVARQLTSQAGLTQAGGNPTNNPSPDGGALPDELPTVTPTGSPLPSPTPTISATTTQTPSFTPPADDPRLTLGYPSYRTDFLDGTNWYLYEDDYVRFDVVDHKFVMTAKQAITYDSWTLTAWKLKNYYIETTGTQDSCSGRDRYGLVVGSPGPGLNPNYLLRFACDGYYSFGYYDVDSKFHYLKDWTKSTYILAGSGQTNRMGFMAEGTHLSLYANGHFLADMVEPAFGEGRFGLFIGSVNTVNYTVRIGEVMYWILP